MSWLLNLFKGKGDGKGFITELGENIDRFVNTPEDKKEVLKMAIEDRQNAREMYANDSTLQKIFALFFLAVWAALLYLLMKHFVFNTIDLMDWQIAFVNMVWGGISSKLNTIVDFLFGSSQDTGKKQKQK